MWSCDAATLEPIITIIKKVQKTGVLWELSGFVLEIPSSYNLSHIPLWDNWKPQSTFLSCLKKNLQTIYDSFGICCQQELEEERSAVCAKTKVSQCQWNTCCTRRADICILNWVLWKTRCLGQFCWTKTQSLALPPHQYLLLWGQLGSSEVVLKKIKVLKGSLPSSLPPCWLASKFTAFQMAPSQWIRLCKFRTIRAIALFICFFSFLLVIQFIFVLQSVITHPTMTLPKNTHWKSQPHPLPKNIV